MLILSTVCCIQEALAFSNTGWYTLENHSRINYYCWDLLIFLLLICVHSHLKECSFLKIMNKYWQRSNQAYFLPRTFILKVCQLGDWVYFQFTWRLSLFLRQFKACTRGDKCEVSYFSMSWCLFEGENKIWPAFHFFTILDVNVYSIYTLEVTVNRC